MNITQIELPGTGKTSLYYEETGQGRPIVFLHGLTNSHRVFDWFFLPYLQGQGRLIRLDLPGFGKSPELKTAHTFETYSQVLKAFLESLGISKVYLIGSSMGATLAFFFTLKFPEFVEAAVVHDPVYQGKDFPKEDQETLAKARNLAVEYPLFGKYLLAGHAISYFFQDIPYLLIKKWYYLFPLMKDFQEFSARSAVDILEDMMTLDFGQELRKIRVPILLVSGDRVSYPPVNTLSRLQKLLPKKNVEAFILPGDHLAPYLWPDLFAQRVIEFFENLPDSGNDHKSRPLFSGIFDESFYLTFHLRLLEFYRGVGKVLLQKERRKYQ